MENPDIYFLKKNNVILVKHFSTKIFSEELLKYSQYYEELQSYFTINHVPFPCCHDIYIHKNCAIILKVTKIYLNIKKLIIYQVICETNQNISNNFYKIDYKDMNNIKSFFWSAVILREYIDLKRSLRKEPNINLVKNIDLNFLKKLEEKCEEKFTTYDENLFPPLLWSNKNSEIINFKKNLPKNILKPHFIK